MIHKRRSLLIRVDNVSRNRYGAQSGGGDQQEEDKAPLSN